MKIQHIMGGEVEVVLGMLVEITTLSSLADGAFLDRVSGFGKDCFGDEVVLTRSGKEATSCELLARYED